MPTFLFEAVDAEGRFIEGRVTERNEIRALDRLKKSKARLEVKALRPTAAPGLKAWLGRFRQVSRDELARLFRQLSMALTAGLGLARSVKMLRESGFSTRLADALDEVERSLHMGSRLSDAMARHPALFDREIVGTLRVSEMGGSLDDALDHIARGLEREADRARRTQAALAYPAFLFVASLGMLAAMLIFFLPRMGDAIRSFNVELSPVLRIILAATDLAGNTAYVALFVETVLFAGGMAWFWMQTEAGRQWWDETLLKTPIVSRVIVSVALTRLAYSIGMMTRCGVGVAHALQLVAGSLGNRVLDQEVADAREFLVHGATLSEALRVQPHIDNAFASMVEVGEETGRLDEAMGRLQRIYDERLDHVLETAVALVEPLILIVMGGVVGGTVLLFMLPLAQLIRSL